jgi:hypothetical protein
MIKMWICAPFYTPGAKNGQNDGFKAIFDGKIFTM